MKTIYCIAMACVFTAVSTFTFAQDDYKAAKKKNKEKFKGSAIKGDVCFATHAANANIMDMQFGQLAQTKGSSQQIKDLGKSMYDGHAAANLELAGIAGKEGIALPGKMSKCAQKHYDKMAKKSGTDFDKAYAKCVIKGHKMEIKCGYTQEAEKGKDPELRTWAAEKLPTLYQHLHMGKDACKALK